MSDSAIFIGSGAGGVHPQQLELSRANRHGLIAGATGTGKTVIAAFDYQRTRAQLGGRPPLLFIAHRVEILQQAIRTFREVPRDPSFGQQLAGGVKLENPDHLFVTIDSLHSQGSCQPLR